MAAETTIAAALVKAQADADDWFLKMGAAADAAKRTTVLLKNANNSYDLETNWTKIRRESQKLLYLKDDHLSIVEELKKVQNTFDEYNSKSKDVTMNIALLQETANLAKRAKARCAKAFEIKLRKKQIEMESIKNEITMANNILPTDDRRLESKHASLEEKIRCCREREANELASFDSKIRESEEQLRKKTTKLKRIEPKLAVAGEALKLMKDALGCCEEAIAMFNLVFVHRLRKLEADFVAVGDTGDVGVIKRIYAMRDRFGGFQLNFGVSTIHFCGEMSGIFRGIDLKLGRLYKLSVDEGGVFHIRQLTAEEAHTLGITHCQLMEEECSICVNSATHCQLIEEECSISVNSAEEAHALGITQTHNFSVY